MFVRYDEEPLERETSCSCLKLKALFKPAHISNAAPPHLINGVHYHLSAPTSALNQRLAQHALPVSD